MSSDDIVQLAEEVTADFEGHNYYRHLDDEWAIEFAKRLMKLWEKNDGGLEQNG